MRGVNLVTMYLFRSKARYVNYKAVNPGFCEKMDVTRNTCVPPGRPSRTTSGTRTTGWEPLIYCIPLLLFNTVHIGLYDDI